MCLTRAKDLNEPISTASKFQERQRQSVLGPYFYKARPYLSINFSVKSFRDQNLALEETDARISARQ